MAESCGFHAVKKLTLVATALVFLAVCATFQALPVAAAEDTPGSAGKIDKQRLVGRWVRPDGGYVLELKEIEKDGTVKAAYLNPRPINVSRAEIRRTEGELSLLIELRDVNYPGSTYNLRYDPATDRLEGTYFQAVHGETYRIEFIRAR